MDLVLQGHDHAYLRTWPMHNSERVADTTAGTVYLVSVAGTKMYDQGDHEYIEVGLANTQTWQILDIQLDGNRLVYHAYDIDGKRVDALIIEK